MKKKIICVILAFILILTTFAACKKEKNKNSEDTTNPTVIESVTNDEGEVVTDAAGKVVTEVYEEVPLTDSKGEQVTADNGEKLTERIPHTTENKATTSTKASIINAIFNTTNNNPQSSTAATINTTRPVKTEPSSDKNTEVPGTTAENKTEEKTTAPTTTKPTTTRPTATKPVTTKPTTTKPTATTTTEAEISKDITYFAQYAKEYGLSIGLTYDYAGNKDNENNGWWTPITFTVPITDENKISYKKAEIRDNLHAIKDMWKHNYGEPKFWVQIEKVDENHYNLYIGY